METSYLAADFGGSSGRLIYGGLQNGRVHLREIHRFPNRQVRIGGQLVWDFPALFQDLKEGMRLAAEEGLKPKSIGIDTWGVDYGLIDAHGHLLGNPVCYRDERTRGMQDKVFDIIDRQAHYQEVGTQVLDINTIFQIYSQQLAADPLLAVAARLLFMPDLFGFFLSGKSGNEDCIASTSELLNATTRQWSEQTIDALGLPKRLFGKLLPSGSIRGQLLGSIARETGLGQIDVVCAGGHDTACAVAGVPFGDEPAAFLSSGTWSLLGVELEKPILSEEARLAEFTNEGGIGGTTRFLQNITGMWILQRLMDEWAATHRAVSYEDILPEAYRAESSAIIPVDDPAFANPESMEMAIADYCRATSQRAPMGQAEYVRCVLESLAEKYGQAVEKLNRLLPQPIRRLHIIGGGSQNDLLNQLTADRLQLPVSAGPVEATALGNILTQAWAEGDISSREEMREVARRSALAREFTPALR